MHTVCVEPPGLNVLSCLCKATDGSLQSEDWTLNMEICDIVNETEEGPKDAMHAVKKRLNGNRNFREVMLALTVLETCVKNCGHRFHIHVANRDFIEGVLVKIITPKSNPPAIVQDKVLSLTQAWADAFRSCPDLTGVVHIYEELKKKGTEFPMADLDALSPIHTPQRVRNTQHSQALALGSSSQTAPTPAAAAATADFNPTQIPTIARLRSELDIVRGNIKVMSEMLTEMVPGQDNASDLELLQELNRTCRAMQHRIVDELIARVSNEEVTEELLHVNDDLNNSFLRYERRIILIDLGPGSPAVVTPRVSATPTSTLQPPAAAASLSTQLAGHEVGADSVPGTLSSLTARNPQDDFDMFAHTRSSSLADQRKNVNYEEPQALVGLASALDIRQQNATGIPVSQSSVMDDIEEWVNLVNAVDRCSPDVSLEFDKFLEERAKSAGKALPSAPAGGPRPPASTSSSNHRTTQQTEDNLFAL
uniref:Target of myb1 like 2 membrane trafficking protein n=1 Tax=Sinocyclocheilus anshuiensis TaxID=1608454 RepID=A0A671SUB2_9TELE